MPNMSPLPSLELFVIITVVFLVSGFVKGVIGLGLPSVSLALLVATLGLKPAMAILVLPALLTNVWQGISGGFLKDIIKRMWVYIIAAFLCTWIGAGILASSNSPILSALLGILLSAYAVLSLTTPQINLPTKWESAAAPAVGALAGLFTGLTGSFVVPGVMYLQALGLPREQFIQAMGVTFTMATVSLGVALGGHGLMPTNQLYLSAFALVPAFLGMLVGVLVRKHLNDARFRQVFFIALLIMGLYILARPLFTEYI
tara:strand:+ start:2703 stop:3476 length:774 start_codon:yes stop_codon:yes gene_type:complete